MDVPSLEYSGEEYQTSLTRLKKSNSYIATFLGASSANINWATDLKVP
jgi:hypothetical protein